MNWKRRTEEALAKQANEDEVRFPITLVFVNDMDETWQRILEIFMVSQALL